MLDISFSFVLIRQMQIYIKNIFKSFLEGSTEFSGMRLCQKKEHWGGGETMVIMRKFVLPIVVF